MSKHNETNHPMPVDPSWNDDEFEKYLVQAFSETGRRAPTLNEKARAEVLQALLVENARLAKANLPMATRQVVQPEPAKRRWAWLTTFLNPRLAMSFGSALAVVLVGVGYFLYGGSRAPTFGTIRGAAIITEKREGILNLKWEFNRMVNGEDEYSVHSLDEVRAVSAVTITLADGSIVTALPNSEFQVNIDAKGENGRVDHRVGETAYQITPSKTGTPKFWVDSPEGLFTVKGTIFRVRTEKSSVVQYTDEGVVGASASGSSTDVRTGEQVRISGQKLGSIELQVPRIQFQSMTVDPSVPNVVFTNHDVITMSARVYPAAILIAMDTAGNEVARFAADKRGAVTGSLMVMPGKKSEFQFYVVSSSDSRRSGLTDKVVVQLDKIAPKLGAFPPTVIGTGAEYEVKGQTEPGAKVLINGTVIVVDANGAFTARLPRPANLTQVQIVARDQAGNTTQIVQQMDAK